MTRGRNGTANANATTRARVGPLNDALKELVADHFGILA
jgi:hypothetical protein